MSTIKIINYHCTVLFASNCFTSQYELPYLTNQSTKRVRVNHGQRMRDFMAKWRKGLLAPELAH